jgi:hypothetical protein
MRRYVPCKTLGEEQLRQRAQKVCLGRVGVGGMTLAGWSNSKTSQLEQRATRESEDQGSGKDFEWLYSPDKNVGCIKMGA